MERNLLDAVIEIANERRQLLVKMKAAVRSHDLQRVFEVATELVNETGSFEEIAKAARQ
jgi:hypothetical protein